MRTFTAATDASGSYDAPARISVTRVLSGELTSHKGAGCRTSHSPTASYTPASGPSPMSSPGPPLSGVARHATAKVSREVATVLWTLAKLGRSRSEGGRRALALGPRHAPSLGALCLGGGRRPSTA
eukprot:CAMPEP_0181371018 /NCGR_PEP_ID=MMETSP1106-20121128/13795_1 /TAXON_ID=81844 /ORGANISM="Mantoniella antarctica, Strain SL-175" /LENGTH=125 /DNA_ID=CAMNT_0023487969 /DNA_START=398 /DNA_END=772 /DNA_ORIENTATION=-